MNSLSALLPIMVYMTSIDAAIGMIQAMPSLQSKKNSITMMATGSTTDPAMSGS